MTREAARWVIGPRSFRRLMPALGWLGPLAFGGPAHGFTAQVEAILDAEEGLAPELGAIDVPTLVVVGNQDILTPRGDSEELADLIPTAELVVISGAAHGLMVEHATTFNRILRDFLGRAESAGHRRDLAGAEAVDRAVVPADEAEELGERLGG
jgi:3-oxoadipate enol-lactonase